MDSNQLTIIKETTQELLEKMTISGFGLEVAVSPINDVRKKDGVMVDEVPIQAIVDLNITLSEPQFLIGQNGQTLWELQRVLRMVLTKKLKENFYLNLDINNYKKNKIEYLKKLAIDSANEVLVTMREKVLPPMQAYERRIIHEALSQRKDVATESQGEGVDRRIVISPI